MLNAIQLVLLVKEFLKTVPAVFQDTPAKEFAFQHALLTNSPSTVSASHVTKNVMAASTLATTALTVPEDTINSVASVSRLVILTCLLITQLTCASPAIPSARPAAVSPSVPLAPILKPYLSMEFATTVPILVIPVPLHPQPVPAVLKDST